MSAESPFSPDWLPLLQDSAASSRFITSEQINIATSVLLWYEYSLTVADEVQYVWRRSYNLSTLLYLLIRYTALLNSLLGVVYRVHGDAITDKSCEFYQNALTVITIITCLAISLFVAARIMALWSRNWYLGAFLFFLGLLNPIALTQIPSFLLDAKAAPQPLPACMDDTSSYALVLISAVYLPTVSSAVNVAYELLCLALTVAQTYKTYKAYYCYARLHYQLLRDGSLYFLVVSSLAIMDVVCAKLDLDGSLFPVSALSNALQSSLIPIMTNRFIVNLQIAALHGTGSSTADPVSTLQFKTRTERILHSVSGNVEPYGYEEAHETAVLGTANCPDTFGGESGSLDRSDQLDLAEAAVPVRQCNEEKVLPAALALEDV